LAQKDFEICEVPPETFFQAFHETKKLPQVRSELIKFLRYRIERQASNVHLFASRHQESGRVIAGLAVCDLPDVSLLYF
jgi:CRP-like cAMP-binding protein